jgi:hypothetical protein
MRPNIGVDYARFENVASRIQSLRGRNCSSTRRLGNYISQTWSGYMSSNMTRMNTHPQRNLMLPHKRRRCCRGELARVRHRIEPRIAGLQVHKAQNKNKTRLMIRFLRAGRRQKLCLSSMVLSEGTSRAKRSATFKFPSYGTVTMETQSERECWCCIRLYRRYEVAGGKEVLILYDCPIRIAFVSEWRKHEFELSHEIKHDDKLRSDGTS